MQEEQLQKIEKQKAQILDRFRPVPQPLIRPSRYNNSPEIKEEEEEKEEEEGIVEEEQPEQGSIQEILDDR